MKSSIVVTVLNEEKTIDKLLLSIFQQSALADEVIIVDGGSTDATAPVISNFQFPISNKQIKIWILKKKGNRAVGRNWGIKQAKNEIIAICDAGCILDKNWLKNIIAPFRNYKVDVVAGYYQGISQNIFQKCLVPYVLVMPDKVNPQTFLPASRSMALRKSIWQKAGRFPEKFSYNEDYVFARKLKKMGAKIVFQKNAIVSWMPGKNLIEAFMMFFKFAKGDIEAEILRPKVVFIFIRYLMILGLAILFFLFKTDYLLFTIYSLILSYIIWAIGKNYRYAGNWRAIVILPVLQLTADLAVLTGSIYGIYKRSD